MSEPAKLTAIAADIEGWPQAVAAVNDLLRDGATVLWATGPFEAKARSGAAMSFDAGTFLVTEPSDRPMPDWHLRIRREFEVEPVALGSVDGFDGLTLKTSRIALYGGGGAPYNHARIFAELGFFVDFIGPREIRQGRLSGFDILVMPGGGGLGMIGQLEPLGEEGCRAIKDFVRAGGMYVGSCAGSYDAARVPESFLEVCPQQQEMCLANALVWNRHDTEWVGLKSPGVGVLRSRTLRPDHPVMVGMPESFEITHYNGPLFEPGPDGLSDLSAITGLSAVAGFTDDFTPAEDFMAIGAFDRKKAEETSLVAQAAAEGRFNVIAGHCGLGRVVLFGSHPEFGLDLGMDRWGTPARMLANAAFWQASYLTASASQHRATVPGAPRSVPNGAGLDRVAGRLSAIADAVAALHAAALDDAAWLDDALAMSTFGLSGREIWTRSLAAFDGASEVLGQTIETCRTAAGEARTLIGSLAKRKKTAAHLADALNEALGGLEDAIHYRVPPEWGQDYGHEGVLQMLDRTEAMLRKALANADTAFEPSTNPYAHLGESPFQLVAGSYLAAIGIFTNARLLLQVHQYALQAAVLRGRRAEAEVALAS